MVTKDMKDKKTQLNLFHLMDCLENKAKTAVIFSGLNSFSEYYFQKIGFQL